MAHKDLPMPTAEQQQVLDRILVQRERLRARKEAYRQTRTVMQTRAGLDPHDPLPKRLAAFAKLHPVAVAALAGVAMLAGPRRLIRVAGLLMPLVSRMRR